MDSTPIVPPLLGDEHGHYRVHIIGNSGQFCERVSSSKRTADIQKVLVKYSKLQGLCIQPQLSVPRPRQGPSLPPYSEFLLSVWTASSGNLTGKNRPKRSL